VLKGAQAGEFWVFSYFSPAGDIRNPLESRIVADDVAIDDLTAGAAGIALVGAGSRALLDGVPGAVFPGRRAAVENWEWVCPSAEARSAWPQGRELFEAGADAMERIRIAAGIPAVPRDAGPGDLPQEAGLEETAVCHTKGCFLGQEVMARLKTRGRVRRRLRLVRGTGGLPDLPAPLWHAGESAGELRSAAPGEAGDGFAGLAMLSPPDLPRGTLLALSASAAPAIEVAL
jgi:folate-binding protein YgfZ